MYVSKKIMDFLLVADDSLHVLTHRTIDEDIANEIIKEGFEYTNSLHKTTDEMINDNVHINYWMKHRDYYGDITIVICISKKLYKKYTELSKKLKIDSEYILSIIPSYINNEGDPVYLLSNHYIRGYFNNITEETVENPDFNPSFDSPQYLQNILEF